MKWYGIILFIIGCLSFVSAQDSDQNPTDTLTRALCDNQEQIVSRRVGEYRIQYFMGETELNMKTMKGFLSLNDASKPIYDRYRLMKAVSWMLGIAGIGLIGAVEPRVDTPKFPVYSVIGAGAVIGAFTIGIKNNRLMFESIYAHNKNICGMK